MKSLFDLFEGNLDDETLVIVFLATDELAVELLLESGIADWTDTEVNGDCGNDGDMVSIAIFWLEKTGADVSL